MNTEQLNIPTMEPAGKTRLMHKRVCENPDCKREYEAHQSNSRYCSSACRSAAWKKNKSSAPQSIDEKETKQLAPAPAQLLTGLTPQLQIAIDLLRKEGDRWEKSYNEERTRRKKAEDEVLKLKEEMLKKEHASALQGIENAKPDMIDRMLNGLSNLPAPIVEQFAPLIGRLGNLLMPSGSAPVEGVQGQLNEPQIQFINWINTMPPETQKNFMIAMAELSRFDEQKLNTVVGQINQFLLQGTTMRSQPFDQAMYGYGS